MMRGACGLHGHMATHCHTIIPTTMWQPEGARPQSTTTSGTRFSNSRPPSEKTTYSRCGGQIDCTGPWPPTANYIIPTTMWRGVYDDEHAFLNQYLASFQENYVFMMRGVRRMPGPMAAHCYALITAIMWRHPHLLSMMMPQYSPTNTQCVLTSS